MEVTLTPAERQTLINQFAILEKLNPEGANDYKKYQDILQRGFAILYDEAVSVWEEMDVEEGRYVIDVLNMHRDLKFSFDELEDKAGLTENDIKYQGFDGNNESKRLSLAEFFGAEGRWTELNLRKNSHSTTTIRRYPPMLKRWREANEKNFGNRLIADQIKYVIDWKK